MELDLPDLLLPAGPHWPGDDCCCQPRDCGGLVIGTELGLAIEDCEGVQVEITL